MEIFSKIQLLDVYIPTQDHRTLRLQRYTEPEQDHKILLEKLNLKLPAQPRLHFIAVHSFLEYWQHYS